MAQQAQPEQEAPEPERLTDRQLLEEITLRLRDLEPLVEAARRHPLIRALLRRI